MIIDTQNTKSMAGPWPSTPRHDLITIFTSCTILIPWGQNWGITILRLELTRFPTKPRDQSLDDLNAMFSNQYFKASSTELTCQTPL